MTLADLNLRPAEVRSLYLVHLQQTHAAEHQLLDDLPGLAINISTNEVRQELLANAVKTSDHIAQLDAIYTELGEVPTGPVCEPIKALVELCVKLILQHPFGLARDVLLISLAKEMKHLEIVKWTMAETLAGVLGYSNHAAVFACAKQVEMNTDQGLTFFAGKILLSTHKS